MTDIIDKAQDTIERELAQSLRVQAAIAANAPRPQPAGHCLNGDCFEPFAPSSPRLFCGPVCAERFETLSKLKR